MADAHREVLNLTTSQNFSLDFSSSLQILLFCSSQIPYNAIETTIKQSRHKYERFYSREAISTLTLSDNSMVLRTRKLFHCHTSTWRITGC